MCLENRDYLAFEALLCPSVPMVKDAAVDRESWQRSSLAGSSYPYFWRHPSSVLRSPLDPSEDGATYDYAQSTGRLGLAMDVNSEQTHPYTSAFGSQRIECHPLLQRVNVVYIGGVVQSYDSDELVLPSPGGEDEQLLWSRNCGVISSSAMKTLSPRMSSALASAPAEAGIICGRGAAPRPGGPRPAPAAPSSSARGV